MPTKKSMEEKIDELSTTLEGMDAELKDFKTKVAVLEFLGFVPFLLVSFFFQWVNYQPILAWSFTTIWVLKVAILAWVSRFSTDDGKDHED